MAKVPRLNENLKESIFCVDDCIATFAENHNLIYQAMYLDELNIEIRQIGKNYNLYFPDNVEANLNRYGGIRIEQISPSEHMLNDLQEILDFSKVIMLEIKGIECPWDWRYKKIDWGNHTFLLTGRNENLLTGTDPYYGISYVEIPIKQLMKGYIQARVLTEVVPDEENLFKSACRTVRCEQGFYKRLDLFKRCFDFGVMEEIMFKNGCFEDYTIENNDLIINLQNCEYSRLRFAIFLQYLNEKFELNPLFENSIRDYLDIAQIWGKVRSVSIKTLISGINNNEVIGRLLEQVCEMEDKSIYYLKKYLY